MGCDHAKQIASIFFFFRSKPLSTHAVAQASDKPAATQEVARHVHVSVVDEHLETIRVDQFFDNVVHAHVLLRVIQGTAIVIKKKRNPVVTLLKAFLSVNTWKYRTAINDVSRN